MSRPRGFAGKQTTYLESELAVTNSKHGIKEYAAHTLFKTGKYIEAEKEYKVLIVMQSTNPSVYLNLTKILETKGRHEEIIELLENAIAVIPDSNKIYSKLAYHYFVKDKLECSIRCYKRALELLPGSIDIVRELGNILRENHMVDEQIDLYSQSILWNPKEAEFYYYLGNNLAKKGKMLEAINSLLSCVSLDPNSSEAHYSLTVAYKEIGHTDQALHHCRLAYSADQENCFYLEQLSEFLFEQKLYEEARLYLKMLIKRKPWSLILAWRLHELTKMIHKAITNKH